MPRTRRANMDRPGISRVGAGRGFSYRSADGRAAAPEDVERIKALAIPPAWNDVWICTDPRGHVQATGTDQAGRKQYLYHEDWRAHRDREKFKAMTDFAAALPRVRRVARADIRARGFTRDRVLAGAVLLLDHGLFRIGTDSYATDNGSFGLTTLQRRHVSTEAGSVCFNYRAKSGVRRFHEVDDRDVHALVSRLLRRTGPPARLLMYKEQGQWRDLRPELVNEYLRELAQVDCSAKDFRTWHATVLAALTLSKLGDPGGKAARERAVREAVAVVAEQLGNTVAVARSSYIDPRVIDRYAGSGETIAATGIRSGSDRARRRVELDVLELIG